MSSTIRQRIGILLSSIGILVALFVPLLSPVASAQFDPLQKACESGSGSAACDNGGGNPVVGEDGILTRAANIITNVTAIVAVIIIIIAGLTMTLSSGNSSQVQSSRDAIIYAAVALAVALLGKFIIWFVIGNLT